VCDLIRSDVCVICLHCTRNDECAYNNRFAGTISTNTCCATRLSEAGVFCLCLAHTRTIVKRTFRISDVEILCTKSINKYQNCFWNICNRRDTRLRFVRLYIYIANVDVFYKIVVHQYYLYVCTNINPTRIMFLLVFHHPPPFHTRTQTN